MDDIKIKPASRNKCCFCNQRVNNKTLIVEVSDYSDVNSCKIGGTQLCYHVNCFESADVTILSRKSDVPGIELFSEAAEKSKCESILAKHLEKQGAFSLGDILSYQNRLLFQARQKISKFLKRREISDILEYNDQYAPNGKIQENLDNLSDILVFGSLASLCPECRKGKITLDLSRNIFHCTMKFEWSDCSYATQMPERKPLVLSKEILEKFDFLSSYVTQRTSVRYFPQEPDSNNNAIKGLANSMAMINLNNQPTPPRPVQKKKLQVKGGGEVDPASHLEDYYHVYSNGDTKYTAILGITDIAKNKNSYYRFQILKSDFWDWYVLFRSWGDIGANSCKGQKRQTMNLKKCITKFEEIFKEKTGNAWSDKKNFTKFPLKMHLMNVDFYGEDNSLNYDAPSMLKEPVKRLMSLIFDVQVMTKTLKDYDIDLVKMPLGKLSEKQITEAYKTLLDIRFEIKTVSSPSQQNLIGLCNKFYTLIPHNFGQNGPKLLVTEEDVVKKQRMLEELMELEFAYRLTHGTNFTAQNPLDSAYEKMKVDIDVLDPLSEEYKMICDYVNKTQGPTHHFNVEVIEIFTVKRFGEEERYRKFRHLDRLLLWHGSRMSNYPGILTNGLKIAPPDAPVSGHMFGKGIYFADMVTKSANYCHVYYGAGPGLVLLCEVAVGKAKRLFQACGNASQICKPPSEFQSVSAQGKIFPSLTGPPVITSSGAFVPYGDSVNVIQNLAVDLYYNEYVVYNEDQVKIQYLVKLQFKNKRLY